MKRLKESWFFLACLTVLTAVLSSPQIAVGQSRTYNIGDTGPAGGIIFYDKGSFSNGWQYLEAAPAETEFNRIEWGAHLHDIDGTSRRVGHGDINTQYILDFFDERIIRETNRAAQLCANLDFGGVTDWFMPSIDELELMYKNLHEKGLGGFARERYWSSTQNGPREASNLDFRNGRQRTNEKFDRYRVRAVRAF